MSRSESRWRTSLAAIGALFLGACASPDAPPGGMGALEPAQVGSMTRVHALDGVYLGGQPSPDDLKTARATGLKTVLNLRKRDEVDWDEKFVAETLGLEYVNVPFGPAPELTDSVFDSTRKLLRDPAKKPVLVHCASANRVGAIWLAHRVLDDNVPYDQALAEAKTIGLKTPALEEKAKSYIERQGQ